MDTLTRAVGLAHRAHSSTPPNLATTYLPAYLHALQHTTYPARLPLGPRYIGWCIALWSEFNHPLSATALAVGAGIFMQGVGAYSFAPGKLPRHRLQGSWGARAGGRWSGVRWVGHPEAWC